MMDANTPNSETKTTKIPAQKPITTTETSSFPSNTATHQNAQAGSVDMIWDRVIQGLIYGLVFILPLLFTTWTFEVLEFSKQTLLVVFTALALGAWLLKILVLRKVNFAKTPLDLPILGFLAIYLLASIFSIDRVASFLGFYGNFTGNFFQVLFLVILYYLIVNNFSTSRDLKRLLGIFLFSVFLAMIFVLLQFFKLYIFSAAISHTPGFNTIGGLLMISLFSALVVVLAIGFPEKSWFTVFGGRAWRIGLVVAAFVVLLTVNFVYAWAALLVGLLFYLIFQVGMSKNFSFKNFLTPLVLVIIVIAFLVSQWVFRVAPFRSLFNFDLPLEIRLDYKTAGPVLQGAVVDRPVLGFGPNTFLYAFSKLKDQNFNLSPFWNARFDRAPSEAAEQLVGTGILGFLAFELMGVIFLIYGLYFLIRRKDYDDWNLSLAFYSGFGVLWFAHWFLFFNTVMIFSFWLMIAGFIAMTRVAGGERVKNSSFSFATSPRQTVSVVTLVSTGLVIVIVYMFFTVAVYASDIYYARGIKQAGNVEAYDQAQADFERAIRLNRFRPDYYLAYGEFLFVRINQELTNSQPNIGLVQQWLASSINTSRAAVDLSPANWTAWERLANLYTFSRPLVAGVDRFIVESLTKAIEKDSKNPILYTELGQVYRLSARRIDQGILGKGADSDADSLSDEQEQVLGSDPEDPDTNGNNVLDGNEVLSGLNPVGTGALPDSFLAQYIKTDPESLLKSVEAFQRAIDLKEDYGFAYYQLALTLEESNKLTEAVEVMEQLLQRFPADVSVKFELGRMYFNNGQISEAARQFQEIVAVQPGDVNSRFSLALSYERLGRTQRALDEYRRVFETNQDNQSLQAKIVELEQVLQAKPLK